MAGDHLSTEWAAYVNYNHRFLLGAIKLTMNKGKS